MHRICETIRGGKLSYKRRCSNKAEISLGIRETAEWKSSFISAWRTWLPQMKSSIAYKMIIILLGPANKWNEMKWLSFSTYNATVRGTLRKHTYIHAKIILDKSIYEKLIARAESKSNAIVGWTLPNHSCFAQMYCQFPVNAHSNLCIWSRTKMCLKENEKKTTT